MAVDLRTDVDLSEFLLTSHVKGVDNIDLRPFIVRGSLSHTMAEGWLLSISVADQTGRIRQHPIFGSSEAHKRPAADVEIDGYWFRLRGVERGNDDILTLEFQERLIDRIARQTKPVVTSRNKATRREFIVARAKGGSAKQTYAPMLHVHRRILSPEEALTPDERRTRNERGGDAGGKAKGGPEEFRTPANKWGKKYHVDPWVLMGIGKVETNFGANNNTSSAGARGFTQFMPETQRDYLRRYGVDAWGSIDEAVHASAIYLRNGGYKIGNDKAIHDAIYSYNHADWYVKQVLDEGKKYRGEGAATDGSEPILNAGDSLAVGTGPKLKDLISNKVQTRAKEGRTTAQALADLKKLKDSPDNWLISLGTNDFDLDVFKRNAKALMKLAEDKTVYWFNIKRASHAGQALDTQINGALDDLAADNSNLVILDWKGLVERQDITMDSESIHPDSDGYQQRAEFAADAIQINDGGTNETNTRTIARSYSFRVGEMQADGKRQNWWEGIQNLSDETQIRSFVDRNVFICMSEEELARAKSIASLSDENVDSISWSFDNGDAERTMTVMVQSTRWAFPPGACVVIHDEGFMDGRYLVISKERSLFDLATTLTLRQPLPELPEPAHETREVTDEPEEDNSDDPGADEGGSGGTVTLGGEKVFRPIDGDVVYGRGWHESSKGVIGQTGTSGHIHWHSGIDASVPKGTPCIAPVDGEITMAQAVWSDGGMVHFRFTNSVGSIKRGTIIGWGHCINIRVHQGQKVKAGQRLADSGNPGGGPHVHFIVRDSEGEGDGSRDPVPTLKALQGGDGSSKKLSDPVSKKRSGN